MLEESIFKNEQVLDPEYLPELLPYRENQIERIANNLNPASKGRKPQNMFIFGVPGVGKTASIKFVFRQFEEYSDRVKTIYINTWDYNTSQAILAKLVLELGFFVQRRGLSKDEILERLIEALKKSNKSVIICLDEIDQLIKRDEKALYDLLRINQYVNNPIGLLMISNYKDIFINIEPRIKSSLDVEDIEFKRYTLPEMKDILLERCKNAFRLGVLEEGVVLLCANHAVQRGGDVRLGLECLRKAARECENENTNKITVKHVKEVLKDVKQVKLKMIKESLQGIEKNIVSLLTEDEITSTDFHKKYVEQFGQISQFGLSKHIKNLQKNGIVKIRESREDTRGRKYFISLMKRKVFK